MSDIGRTLGARISAGLLQHGMTQRQLADRVGVTEVSIGRYINGTRMPKADTVVKIADVLCVSTDYLLGVREAKVPRVLSADEFAATQVGCGWLENWYPPSDGEPDFFELRPFVWADGNTACIDGNSTVENLLGFYNQLYGCRVWTGDVEPTEAQRRVTPWK